MSFGRCAWTISNKVCLSGRSWSVCPVMSTVPCAGEGAVELHSRARWVSPPDHYHLLAAWTVTGSGMKCEEQKLAVHSGASGDAASAPLLPQPDIFCDFQANRSVSWRRHTQPSSSGRSIHSLCPEEAWREAMGNLPRGSGDAVAVSGGAAVDGPHTQQRRGSRPAAGRRPRESSHRPAAVRCPT